MSPGPCRLVACLSRGAACSRTPTKFGGSLFRSPDLLVTGGALALLREAYGVSAVPLDAMMLAFAATAIFTGPLFLSRTGAAGTQCCRMGLQERGGGDPNRIYVSGHSGMRSPLVPMTLLKSRTTKCSMRIERPCTTMSRPVRLRCRRSRRAGIGDEPDATQARPQRPAAREIIAAHPDDCTETRNTTTGKNVRPAARTSTGIIGDGKPGQHGRSPTTHCTAGARRAVLGLVRRRIVRRTPRCASPR